MYLMYVDESGDSGIKNSPTRFFVLSGLVIHELRWQSYLEDIITFRRLLRDSFDLKLREEFHAAKLISNPKGLVRIKRNDRLAMIRMFADMLLSLEDIRIINVVIDKDGKSSDYDVFEMAWKTLIQRFVNTIVNTNFPGPASHDETGLIVPDNTENKKLVSLIRKMRRYNPIPHNEDYGSGYRDRPICSIIEDPFFKDSRHSYFIQAVDLAAFLLYQHKAPNNYMKKKSGYNYFKKLRPILCTDASRRNPDGIVMI